MIPQLEDDLILTSVVETPPRMAHVAPAIAPSGSLHPRNAGLAGLAQRALAEARPAPSAAAPSADVAQVRTAVIGLGYWGPNLIRNLYAVLGSNLRACCDIDPTRARAVARQYPGVQVAHEPRAIFSDPDIDAVAIATPVSTHYRLAKAALMAGKSVLLEKPMAASLEQAEELVDLARRRGVVLMVDHTFLFSPAVRKVKEIVDAGQLGDLLYIDSVRINLGVFHRDINVVWDLAPHDLSIVDHLIGRPPKSLAVFGATHTGNGMENIAYLSLDYGDGLIANFHVNWLSPVKVRHFMIGGSRRSLIYNDLDILEKVKVYDTGITVREDDLEGIRRQLIEYRTGDIWSPHIPNGEPLRHAVEHFVACVAGQHTPVTDGEAGLRIVRLLDAAQRSIKEDGKRIVLTPSPEKTPAFQVRQVEKD